MWHTLQKGPLALTQAAVQPAIVQLTPAAISRLLCAQVLFTDGLWVPLVNVQNVYVLPGIPRLFKQMLAAHQGRFNGPPFLSAVLYTNTPEGDLAGMPLAQQTGLSERPVPPPE